MLDVNLTRPGAVNDEVEVDVSVSFNPGPMEAERRCRRGSAKGFCGQGIARSGF